MNEAESLLVCLICGGPSVEHKISIISACNVAKAAQVNHELAIIYITPDNEWRWLKQPEDYLQLAPEQWVDSEAYWPCTLALDDRKADFYVMGDVLEAVTVDIIFPVVHGWGENGLISGLCELANIPYVGCNHLSAAIAMNKRMTKELALQHNVPVVPYVSVFAADDLAEKADQAIAELGLPLFVKAVSTGSAIGVYKVKTADELLPAIEKSLQYDAELVVEQAIVGREIETAPLGNDEVIVANPGEVVAHREFYDYQAKYLDEKGADTLPQADLDEVTKTTIQAYSATVFRALNCSGLARIDFFLAQDGQVYLNEVNPIPGFTNISLYPQMWQASGMSYGELIQRLIQLGLERFQAQADLITDYQE